MTKLAAPVGACRACGGALSIGLCDLGEQPLANSYVRPSEAAEPDPHFPLEVRVCSGCRLAQLTHIVDERAIFSDYAYLSSTSTSWLRHAESFCSWAIPEFGLNDASFVVEVASNDGYLLRNVVAAGIPCLGIEPANNVAQLAREAGVPTEVAFFGRAVADDLVGRMARTADLVIANNVLAHVPDLHDFVAGLAILAGQHGVISIEVPHLLRLIDDVQFDTIYHEHYAYWSLLALERLFAQHDLEIFDLHRLETHGGSLRLFASAIGERQPAPPLIEVRAAEREAGLEGLGIYRDFDDRVARLIDRFRDYVAYARREGRVIAAYGAAAKGNTFLNRAGMTADDIVMVADANPLKQGRLLPGSRIPVTDPGRMLAAKPDDIIILPWNLRTEVAAQLRGAGFAGRLVTAIPRLTFE